MKKIDKNIIIVIICVVLIVIIGGVIGFTQINKSNNNKKNYVEIKEEKWLQKDYEFENEMDALRIIKEHDIHAEYDGEKVRGCWFYKTQDNKTIYRYCKKNKKIVRMKAIIFDDEGEEEE